jgi:hypothetical protein
MSVGAVCTINLVRRAGRPPTLYIAQRQGPTVHKRTDAPDQGARQGVGRAVGLIPLEINLTFSPLISSLLLTLYFTRFITDQYIEHVLSSQLNCRSNQTATIHFSILKQILLLLGLLWSRNHRLPIKPMPAKCSLNTLGGKPFVSGSASISFVLICLRLIVWS